MPCDFYVSVGLHFLCNIWSNSICITSHELKCLLTDWKEATAPCHLGLVMSSYFFCAYTICQNFTLHTLASGLASQHYQYILVRDLRSTVCYHSHIISLYLLFLGFFLSFGKSPRFLQTQRPELSVQYLKTQSYINFVTILILRIFQKSLVEHADVRVAVFLLYPNTW